ncbi:MAG: Cyclopropane-fatty-acyl-phospholipid synthase, partial [Acidobacteria bacterium]|nr:Cyclopropane-fatty-acyl-phospholipid synthase [Acidobacteriota bacterium]
MKETIVPGQSTPGIRVVPSGLTGGLSRVARRAVLANLEKLECGRITIFEDDQRYDFGGDGLRAIITIYDPRFYTDLAFGGSIGAAEAYMSGFWSVDDLTSLVRIIALNRNVLSGMEGGLAIISRPIHGLLHLVRKNTLTGSRRNIAAHYDLGNDF